MKLQFISFDNLDAIKSNLPHWLGHFREDSSDWLAQQFDGPVFSDTKYLDIPDFTLDMSQPQAKASMTDADNVERVYGNLKFLSESQASDERLWVGLCFGPFWNYVRYRCQNLSTENDVKNHFFFNYGARRSLTRNAMARLWWIGKLTYDESRSDPWELTRFVCENQNFIVDVLERNTSNSAFIVRAFLDAVLEARKRGLQVNKQNIAALAKYLNLLGGTYILDCLPPNKIYDKILAKAEEIINCNLPK